LQIGSFPLSSRDSDPLSQSTARTVTIVALALLFLLAFSLICLIVWKRNQRIAKKKTNVYSVSRGNIAVMADLHRISPKYDFEVVRRPRTYLPAATSTNSSKTQV
jgi:hypothetical protein